MPATEPKKFADLFNNPSVEGMHGLTPQEFEHFVAYVLRRAGYHVKEVGPHWLKGVDLEMRLPGKPGIVGGVECKRFAASQIVTVPIVQKTKGAASVSKPSAKPFVVTTSDFNDAAHQTAKEGSKHAYLLNGRQFVRYIRYIRGSRHDDDDILTTLSPEEVDEDEFIRRLIVSIKNYVAIGATYAAEPPIDESAARARMEWTTAPQRTEPEPTLQLIEK